MSLVEIEIEVMGVIINAEVEYTYTKGYPARLHGLPENNYEEQPDQWEIHSLMLENDFGMFSVDVTELVDYIKDQLIEDIIEQLEEDL